jgi:putative SOS response-associated peptidase YedK
VWRGPKDAEGNRTGDPLRSATIITTTPNETMEQIHDRMPVILPASAWDAWLDPGNDDIETLGKLLVPAPAVLTDLRPVTTLVNSVRNKGAELTRAAAPDEMIEGREDAATG